MKYSELLSTKKKISVLFAGHWSSGMITLRIVGCKRSRVSIPGCPLFPFSFNAMIQETS